MFLKETGQIFKFWPGQFCVGLLSYKLVQYFETWWKNINSAANNSLDTINSVLNKYAPIKKVNKYKLRIRNKPWITSGIQKAVYIKNKLLKKIINKEDPQSKAIFHEHYKTYRNLLSTLMKQSKQIYYTKYFENNWNNIKNTWEGIKTIILIKNTTATVPHSIEFNNKTITDPTAMSNVFNNSFTSIAKKINSNTKFSPKHYTGYLSYWNTNTFFLTPTDKNEI